VDTGYYRQDVDTWYYRQGVDTGYYRQWWIKIRVMLFNNISVISWR
jgi:hypothetical protein